ncbi:MAG: hypothetical protein SVX43_21555 [Cyanobacteriota bacterium]|nr:hypothetical protein [Cyanobacteriota bacterium]
MRNPPQPKRPFTEQDTYPCPVCRCGQLSALSLMEAMSCNFCHHMFATNIQQQSIVLADSHLALTWRWSGKTWKGLYREGLEIGWDYFAIGAAFVLLPPLLVGCAAYLFPPIPGTPFAWFPIAWTILAFVAHLACVLWLLVEYYQLPIALYVKALERRLWNRLGRSARSR